MDLIPAVQVLHTFQIIFSTEEEKTLNDVCRRLRLDGDLNNFIFPLEVAQAVGGAPPPLSEVDALWTPWDVTLKPEKCYFWLIPELRVFEDLTNHVNVNPVDLRRPNSASVPCAHRFEDLLGALH